MGVNLQDGLGPSLGQIWSASEYTDPAQKHGVETRELKMEDLPLDIKDWAAGMMLGIKMCLLFEMTNPKTTSAIQEVPGVLVSASELNLLS